MQHLSRLLMIGSLVAWIAGCDDGGTGSPAAGGSTGSGGGGNTPSGAGSPGGGAPGGVGTQVTWSDMGWIEGTANDFGIMGAWYSYDDCTTAMGLPCTERDAGLTGPDMKTGWAVRGMGSTGEVCAKGTAAKVADDASYGKQWGFGLAFDLASPGGTAAKMAFNASAKSITGFSFDIKGSAPAKLRINIPISEPDDASYFREVNVTAAVASNSVVFTDTVNFRQGPWVMTQTPTLVRAFNPASIYAIQFQVFTNTTSTTPFDFCVSNFRVLK